MPNNRQLTYTVVIDTSSARQQAAAMRAAFENELKQIKVGAVDSSGLNQFNGQAQQAAQGYGAMAQGADKLKKSNEGVGASLENLIAGYLSLRGAQSLVSGLSQLDTLGTQAIRTAFAFDELSGGAQQASTNVLAIQRAGSGTIGALEAMRTGVTALSLNLADTAAEFSAITTAARAVTVVSPIIDDVGEAISQLGIAAANLSYRRLDQLGLAVGDVRDRIKELKRENDGLDDSQAFLAATVGLLNEKYGDLVNSTEAAATGQERLTVAFGEFARLVATTDIAKGVTEGFFGDIAGLLEAANVSIFGKDSGAFAIENQLAANAELAKKAFMSTAPALEEARGILQRLNDAAIEGKVGIAGYQDQALGVAASIVRWGTVTDEQIAKLRELEKATFNLGTPNDPNSFAPNGSSAVQARNAADEQRKAGIFEQQGGINEALTGAAQKSIGTLGVEKAIELLKQQKMLVDQAMTDLAADATIVNPDEIALRLSEIQQQATQVFADAASAMPEVDPTVTAESFGVINEALANLNQGFIDFLPNTAALRDELIALNEEIAFSGVTTDEQAARLEYISDAAAAAANEQSLLTAVTSELGVAFLSQNEAAAATVDAMYQAQAAYMAGQLTAVQYAGVMAALGGQLLSLASDAGVATGAILALNAAQGGAAGLPGFAQGQAIGGGVAQRIQTQQAQRERETARRQAEQAAKKAQAEAERAAKRAASEAERGAKRAAKALEDGAKKAAQELKSALNSVPGLFNTTSVTEQDMKLAKGGAYQDKADEYLRRLRDEIENGVDYAGVSIEDAKAALESVGIKAAEDSKLFVDQFAEAWDSGVLVCHKDNLKFIDQAAVQLQLDLQEKAKQGQENIYELFGVAVEDAVEAVGAGISGGGGGISTGAGGAGSGITIPVKAELIPMTAEDTAGATGGGGSFAITPTIDTQAIQDQLDLLTLPPFEVTAMGLADLQTQIDAITPTIKIKSSLDGGSFAALFEKVQSTKPTITVTASLAATSGADISSDLADQLSAQVATFKSQGQTIGAVIKAGFSEAFNSIQGDQVVTTDLADAIIGDIGTQLGARVKRLEGVGAGVGDIIKSSIAKDMGTVQWQDGEIVAPIANGLITAISTQVRGTTDGFKREGTSVAQLVMAGISTGLGGVSAEGIQSADLAFVLAGNLNTQFSTNANFFYAAGQTPAQNVVAGYKGYFTTDSNEGAPLVTPLVTAINTQIRVKAEDFKNQGITLAQYVQNGVAIGFNSESFKTTLISVGESMYSAIRTGLLNAADGGDLVDMLGSKILADISQTVEQPQ